MRSASARRGSRALTPVPAPFCSDLRVIRMGKGYSHRRDCQNAPLRSRACQWYVHAASFRSSPCLQPFAFLIYCRSWPRQACSALHRPPQLRRMSRRGMTTCSRRRALLPRGPITNQAAACSVPGSRSSSRKAGRPTGDIPAIPACRRSLDFSKSQNVKAVTVLYPAPARFPDGAGGNSIGYKGVVILPLHVVPQDAASRCGSISSSTMRCAKSFACRRKRS